MWWKSEEDETPSRGFLARLAHDKRGNTITIMAVAMIPMAGLAGSAVDTARLYAVRVRLQQACDAGVLAGRKFMTDSKSETLDDNAATQARTFFNNNIRPGWMSVRNPSFTPVKTADQQVAGTATAVVPMAVMGMFGIQPTTISVRCEARYDVPDVDIMFVLDTTGSMACTPAMDVNQCHTYVNNAAKVSYARPSGVGGVPGYAGGTNWYVTESTSGGTNNSRIEALRTAVKEFYATVAKNVDPSTHVRYGFVTYSSMVNPGQAILDKSPAYILGGSGSSGATTWTYQSRKVSGEYRLSSTPANPAYNGNSSTNCSSTVRDPAGTSGQPFPFNSATGRANKTVQKWDSTANKCAVYNETWGPKWTYQPATYDVRNYVSGQTVTDPSKVNGSTSRWIGCVEERQTTAGSTSYDVDALPADLDPEGIPNSDTTRWKPLWPEATYLRQSWDVYPETSGDTIAVAGSSNYNTSYADEERLKAGFNACGKPVQRLREMTAADINGFVTAADFRALGGTYHDIGMIWGTRLLSPRGVFASDTAPWDGRQAPRRVLIFLTDGIMSPNENSLSVYGVERLDRRVAAGSTGELTNMHNARFLAECRKARSLGIDVWTIAIDDVANANLDSCASAPAQSTFTTTGKGLTTAFKNIAERVAMLRVSR